MTAPAQCHVARGVTTKVVSLAEIPAGWDAAWLDLAAHAAEPNPFAESWFMRPAIRHLKPDPTSKMVTVWDNALLLGMIGLTTAPRYGRMPIRHVENWMHYHCFYGVPLVREGYAPMFWREVLAVLDGADWAPNFLHLVGLDPAGPMFAALRVTRRVDVVHTSQRAMLKSTLTAAQYYQANVRAKKRKELGRLRSRLDEIGTTHFARPHRTEPIEPWIDGFLALEASGWKGRNGTALADAPTTAAFFADMIRGAHAAGKLEIVQLSLDDTPIAMLINLMAPPGGFAFKIAFDEKFARFSPGVLTKVENLNILDRGEIDWMDSCAAADHPMINSLWAERRTIVRVTVPLSGHRRRAVFSVARMIENAVASAKALR